MDTETSYEYEPEWGAAYYLGDEDGLSNYKLVLTAGRTDEDEQLISGGAILSLILSSPISDMPEHLPDGVYTTSATKGSAYAIVEGSVMTRSSSGKAVNDFSIDRGELYVDAEEDGSYEIRAELGASSCSFEFDYDGRMRTFDLTTPI